MPLSIPLSQTRSLIETQLQLLWSTSHLPRDTAPVMLWGPPGIGKSQMIRELCEAMAIGFIDVRLSQMEPVDLRGLPVPDGESVKWLVADTWPRDPASRGIVLFDELPAADRSLQVAAYELLLDRRLGDLYRLPDGWLVMGAGNRLEDRAVSSPMSSALANRFLHLELEADIESWTRYAVTKGLHPTVVAFLRFKPEWLLACDSETQRGWPSPRSWERVATLLAADLPLDEDDLRVMLQGLVGPVATTEFMAFRDWTQARIDVPALLHGEAPIVIPERTDQQLAFAAALAYYLWLGDDAQQSTRLAVFLQIGCRLGSDLATLTLMDALRCDDETVAQSRAEQLFTQPGFMAWLECHGVPMEDIEPVTHAGLPEGRFSLTPALEGASGKNPTQGGCH